MTMQNQQDQSASASRFPFSARKRFQLGHLCATPGAVKAFGDELVEYLVRHAEGDWGDLCQEDASLNELALERGERIFSSYNTEEHGKLWIITEADRSVTTALLPEEY